MAPSLMAGGSAACAMGAAEQPVSFLLHLPLGDCSEFLSSPARYLESEHHVLGSSATALHVVRRPGRRGWSLVPFASILDLGIRFPHIRELHLGSLVVHHNTAQGAPLQVQDPRFEWLESLVVSNWSANLPSEGVFSSSTLRLLQHMPRLRNLTVYAPTTHPFVEPTATAGAALQYPELPCSLAQFICDAAIPVSACAHIISSSRDTLDELKVNVFDDEDAPLIAALVRAAPRLRELDLGLRLHTDSAAWPRVKSVFAALVRLRILSLETPLGLHPTLELLAGLDCLRALTLWCTVNVREAEEPSAAAAQLTTRVLRSPCLRSVTVCGFNVSDAERGELLALCRSRRIDCYIAN